MSVFLYVFTVHSLQVGAVGLPAWWNGNTCDTNNYPGSYQLSSGSVYDGVIACGPGPNQGGSDHNVQFTGYSWTEYEWECVELSMRFLDLVYGVGPYSAPGGKDVVNNYSGSALTKVSNNGTSLPSPGDIFSVGSFPGNSFGHTGVITGVNVTNGNGNVSTIEQNASSSGVNTINVVNGVLQSNVTGWLHNPATPPTISTTSLPDAAIGEPYNLALSASGTAPITWQITSGVLPQGLSLSSGGVISGTTEHTGSTTFTVKASNSAGNASTTLTMHMDDTQGKRATYDDGNLFAFADGSDGQQWYVSRSESTGWSPDGWKVPATPSGVSFPGQPNAIQDDANLFVFTRGSDGGLWYASRSDVTGSWSTDGWKTQGQPSGVNLTGDPAAAVSAGNMFAFATGSDGNLWYVSRSDATGSWSPDGWKSLAQPSGVTLSGSPTAVVSAGNLFVFATGSDGNLWYVSRNESTGVWSAAGWKSLSKPSGVTLTGTSSAVDSAGNLFVFLTGSDSNLWYVSRSDATGSWSSAGWKSQGQPTGVTLTGQPGTVVSAGTMFIFATGSDGKLWYLSRDESTGWSPDGWKTQGQPSGVTLSGRITPVVSANTMFAFAVGSDGQLWYVSRDEPTGVWSAAGWKTQGQPTGVTLTTS